MGFVFPSLYEGFGLPILEAFSNNCAVALSNASCFPEIAGKAALYFNPKDRNDIKKTVTTLVSNSVMRNQLIKNGKEYLRYYSWQKTAAKTLVVYENVIKEKKFYEKIF